MPDLDPFALVTASEGAAYCHVSVSAVYNWANRGYVEPVTGQLTFLEPARRPDGSLIKNAAGYRQFCLLELAKAEAATRARARRAA